MALRPVSDLVVRWSVHNQPTWTCSRPLDKLSPVAAPESIVMVAPPATSYGSHDLVKSRGGAIGPSSFTGIAARMGLRLTARQAPLQVVSWCDRFEVERGAKRHRVHGLYDPSLHRIELFGCVDSAADNDLVRVLAHELAHASGIRDEGGASDAAKRAVNALEQRNISRIASELRAQARWRPAVAAPDSNLDCPLSMGP